MFGRQGELVVERGVIEADRRGKRMPARETMMHAEFFVGWGTLAIINVGLAQAKGQSRVLW